MNLRRFNLEATDAELLRHDLMGEPLPVERALFWWGFGSGAFSVLMIWAVAKLIGR